MTPLPFLMLLIGVFSISYGIWCTRLIIRAIPPLAVYPMGLVFAGVLYVIGSIVVFIREIGGQG